MEFPQWVVDRLIARQGCLHPYDTLDAARTAFVVIDLQNYYTQPGYLGECAPARATFPAVNRLADALRAAGGHVIWVQTTSDGAEAFWSHHHAHMLTPERAIEIQCLLGSDIQMQLDECIELPAEPREIERAMELSLRWAERSRRAFEAQRAAGGATRGQALFGIVQGGTEAPLRRRSAEALVAMDLEGYAVGGLAVGEGHELMLATL
ncbi:MAG: isochorismatase family protein, partial [Burkholderiaceae bacterium]|nr:isochorismatase family protein [Burkholderiaceae bacterium]